MEEFLNGLSTNFDDSFSLYNYILHIVICALLLTTLGIVYRRFGQSLSNRSQLAKVLVVVGLTTFVIISIVKSSLALSLGLVGALSIVRFRTAIKEPEELGYFFMAIAIGLGMGANQLLPTLVGFVILMLIVVIQNKSSFGNTITQNLLITISGSEAEKTALIENVTQAIEKSSQQLEVKRIQFDTDHITMNFLINVKSLDKLNEINKDLQDINKTVEVTFIDSTI